MKDLCWLAVNVRGCRAYVQVRERLRPPARVNETVPTNVIARCPGLVTQVRALDGEKQVLPGTVVQQGQLLISGVVDTGGAERPSVTTRFLAGKGTVRARTWYELSVRIPLTCAQKVYTGAQSRSFAVRWGEHRLKIGANGSSILLGSCDKIKNQTKWSLFGLLSLPITWETETCLPYTTALRARSRAEAQAQGSALLRQYLAAHLGDDGSVRSARVASAVQGGYLLVTLSAECDEQIGVEVPIQITES